MFFMQAKEIQFNNQISGNTVLIVAMPVLIPGGYFGVVDYRNFNARSNVTNFSRKKYAMLTSWFSCSNVGLDSLSFKTQLQWSYFRRLGHMLEDHKFRSLFPVSRICSCIAVNSRSFFMASVSSDANLTIYDMTLLQVFPYHPAKLISRSVLDLWL